jgi:Fur family ferric uptake transcriptional regulator
VEHLINRYRAELSKKGVKYTRSRDILLRYILSLREHFNADLLYLNSKASGIDISRATIYRNLPLFEECGIIKKALRDKDSHYYELSIKKEHHDHLVCIECGKIIEFYSKKIELIQREIYKNYKFSPTSHQLILRGVCDKCGKKNEKNTGRSSK